MPFDSETPEDARLNKLIESNPLPTWTPTPLPSVDTLHRQTVRDTKAAAPEAPPTIRTPLPPMGAAPIAKRRPSGDQLIRKPSSPGSTFPYGLGRIPSGKRVS